MRERDAGPACPALLALARRRERTLQRLIVVGICLLLVACAPVAGDAAAGPAIALVERTPEDVAAALSETASLEAAASQLASVLQIAPDAVRVRIQDSNCSVCNIEMRTKLGALEGLSVDEAAPLIEVNMTFWLVGRRGVRIRLLAGLHPARAGLR